jgi:ABC-2 type transport system ATP-binding protein
MPPALSFDKVTKTYLRSHLGMVTATRGVSELSLEVAEGEVFGLLGLNGNGKTTTMKLALGLLRPTSGSVRVFGREPGSMEALGSVGYLPELPYFYPYLTPRESLAYYARLSGVPKAGLEGRIDEVLRSVGLEKAAKRSAGEFSKGMLQRLGLAQALLHQPKLILLDEPVSGLDPLAIHDVRELLLRINRAGSTLLLSSHSISDVERLCSRVGILVEGKLVRVLSQPDWSAQGGLEKIFVDTVRPAA